MQFFTNWMPVIIMGAAGSSLAQQMSYNRFNRDNHTWTLGGFLVGAVAFYALIAVVASVGA